MAVLLHTAVSLGYLQSLPLFNWPDEPAHFNVVRDLAQGRGLGVMEPQAWDPETLERLKSGHFQALEDPVASAEIAGLRYQSHQPPLYYLAAAGLYRLWPSPAGLKLLNLTLSCLALIAAALLARRVAPGVPWVWAGAVALLALLPMRAFLAVSIGNDVAAELLFALFALAVVSGRSPARVGLLAGAGILAKASLALTLPLYGLWLVGRRVDGGAAGSPAWRAVWRPWLIGCGVAVAVASPWLARNVLLYGWADPLALSTGALGWQAAGIERPGLELVGEHGVAAFLAILYQSWWGVFGWLEMFPEPRVLAVYLLLTVLAVAGWVRLVLSHRARPTRSPGTAAGRDGITWAHLWLVASLAALAIALAIYSLTDFQPQGRYLLTAAAASGVLFGRGLAALLGRLAPWGVVGLGVALLAANLHTIRSVIPWYLAGGG